MSYGQYSGGNGDGFNADATCNTNLNGTSSALTIGTISGSSIFCNNGAETYSISIATGSADSYNWSGPTGTAIASQQIDGSANLLFGNTSGNVTVQVSNACATVSTNLAVTNTACQQFFGGNNDGQDDEASCSTTLNGVGTGLAIGTISGPSAFCDNSNETFSINVTAGAADNFLWTGPTGTIVASQQIDGYANLLFGSTSGNVTVQVSNACATVSTNLAVTNTACQQFFGGNNDGQDDEASCSTTLNGVGTGLTIGTISGPSSFCDNSNETFSINVTAGAADNFLWTGPTGTTVASQQIDGYANLLFGNTSGNVTVQVSNACATVSTNLAVTNTACTNSFGGNGDGFAYTISSSSISLPVELIFFQATVEDKSVKLEWSTASETDNDYFLIERSSNLHDWKPLGKTKGVGNSSIQVDYTDYDTSPYPGLSYYRLKQVDFDGSTSYSEVVSVIINSHNLSIYPNPAHNLVYIQLRSNQPTLLSVTNISGTTLLKTQPATTDLIPIDLSNMKSGIYFIRIQNSSMTETRKIELVQ
ncbi:MAG: T9SS type A sorting domain-containing protein [Reichenbachiella sp.]|uniref:T9SS type A sorting domain-containing protein n=3 Tax=Reichenbachiella sp. TaxID=2184521 RepID=UPI0032674565